MIFVLESKSDNLTLFNGRKLTGTDIRHMIKKNIVRYIVQDRTYIVAIAVSVLRFTTSDYPFSIFKLLLS
jgi:hypothetical protein